MGGARPCVRHTRPSTWKKKIAAKRCRWRAGFASAADLRGLMHGISWAHDAGGRFGFAGKERSYESSRQRLSSWGALPLRRHGPIRRSARRCSFALRGRADLSRNARRVGMPAARERDSGHARACGRCRRPRCDRGLRARGHACAPKRAGAWLHMRGAQGEKPLMRLRSRIRRVVFRTSRSRRWSDGPSFERKRDRRVRRGAFRRTIPVPVERRACLKMRCGNRTHRRCGVVCPFAIPS